MRPAAAGHGGALPASILLLEHPKSPSRDSTYLARFLLEAWEPRCRVVRHADPRDVPAADLLFMHVDLSVLPRDYQAVAARFPATVNAGLTDIRKRRLSHHQVFRGDGYTGPVIVKSSLNYAGQPERRAAGETPPPRSASGHVISSKADYQVLPTADDVPDAWWDDEQLVIERFVPERHDGQYVLREWYFLGDAEFTRAETAPYPVITSGDYRPDLVREIPPNLRRFRRQWQIDYGKIDFVMHQGEAVIFDLNKTPTVARPDTEAARRLVDTLAAGLGSLLARQRAG